jgi:hypothetical protein
MIEARALGLALRLDWLSDDPRHDAEALIAGGYAERCPPGELVETSHILPSPGALQPASELNGSSHV